ncbi:MAG TPA: BON domain-containing protein [Nitrospirales bacterium]|nr:BON domain-containing protein [Nitrospira sp. MA-1]HNP61951.1 BON domain-containing protein [Nitrospirales bacterium]
MKYSIKMKMVACLFFVFLAVGCAGGPQKESFGEHIDDSVITTKVKTALLSDPEVSGTDINVTTFKGRVQLNGLVNDAQQIDQAVQLARRVGGVQAVENNLSIK